MRGSLLLLCVAGCAASNPISRPTALVHVEPDDLVGVTTSHAPTRSPPPEFEDTDTSAVRLFHDVLAPYGTWTNDPRLGFVWVPSKDGLGEAFVPYATNGRWTHRTVEGVNDWVWVSDLPWGWVTFHYGRWAYIGGSAEQAGWAWIPGRRYSGAWVDWRLSEEPTKESVIGWGPTPPSHVWQMSPSERYPVAVAYVAWSTPYAYAKTKYLFARDLSRHLMFGGAALAVAHATVPAAAPSPSALGFAAKEVPGPPTMDRGLQQAWMLATPANANAVGLGEELGPPPHLRTWVAGGQ